MLTFPEGGICPPPPRTLISACQEDFRLNIVLLLMRATLKRSHFLWNQTKDLNTSVRLRHRHQRPNHRSTTLQFQVFWSEELSHSEEGKQLVFKVEHTTQLYLEDKQNPAYFFTKIMYQKMCMALPPHSWCVLGFTCPLQRPESIFPIHLEGTRLFLPAYQWKDLVTQILVHHQTQGSLSSSAIWTRELSRSEALRKIRLCSLIMKEENRQLMLLTSLSFHRKTYWLFNGFSHIKYPSKCPSKTKVPQYMKCNPFTYYRTKLHLWTQTERWFGPV